MTNISEMVKVGTIEDFPELVECIETLFDQGFKYQVRLSYAESLSEEPQSSWIEYKFIFQQKWPKNIERKIALASNKY